VFVPGLLDEPTMTALVDGIGERKVSVINVPGSLAGAAGGAGRGAGVVRAMDAALDADLPRRLAEDLYAGGALPEGERPLN
jgi:hypothetical protein